MVQQSAQRFARHSETGAVWDANEVEDALRQGPWECVVIGCPVIYSTHRRPYTRFRNGVGEAVSGSFVIRDESTHDVSLPHERIPGRSSAQRVDRTSRRHIHRLTGLLLPHIETPTNTGEHTGRTRTRFEYGYSINTAAGLVQFAQAIDAEPDLAISERIRFGDTVYTWNELAYSPSRPAFSNLFSRMEAQTNPGRVYFVQGVVKYHAYVDTLHPELLLLRVLADPGDEGQELWVFMPNAARFRLLVDDLPPGKAVALVANELVTGRHRPALSITETHQLEFPSTT